MIKHILFPFLLFLPWVETKGQKSPPQSGALASRRDGSILGKWCLAGGTDTVFMEFDRSNLYIADHDTFTHRIQDDFIAIDDFHDGIQSQGFIRKLTSDSLLIEWTTGDSNLYQRVR